MKALTLSAAFTTDKIEETKTFYTTHFNARVTFDCGWYLNLEFGSPTTTLQFMTPQEAHHQLASGAGLIYNFSVEDVDAEYRRLSGAGLPVNMPLEDHPWGDRGFATQDPNGISLYIYSDREPSEEFKPYFK
ncbi:MAG: glyoxalase [Desulfobacteraceae bacterium]|nr:MAG: glyoxalase [Desulfobacteraceae bacterium]